jgi:sporulation-control protein spo0M
MGFSEKMRDSLGAEGAKLEVTAPAARVAAGAGITISVAIIGGTKAAIVDALTVRIVEADRHWVDGDGNDVSEADAQAKSDRSGLKPAWSRTTRSERRVAVDVTVEPGARHEVAVELTVPDACRSTSAACNHAVHVQADIKGQIDPTAQARLEIG